MSSRTRLAAAVFVVAGLAAACSGAAATPSANPATAAPVASPAVSAGAAGGGSTVMTATVGTQGTLIVAGSNGMTVYTFTKDTAGNGQSACTGGCLAKWPAVTAPCAARSVRARGS